jgi:hypothetical protein
MIINTMNASDLKEISGSLKIFIAANAASRDLAISSFLTLPMLLCREGMTLSKTPNANSTAPSLQRNVQPCRVT